MPGFINTKQKANQFNGPINSADENLRIEQNYQDLVYLYNKSGVLDEKLRRAFERVLKDHIFLSQALLDVEDRVKALEFDSNQMSIYRFSQIDTNRFIGTEFQVNTDEALSFDPRYNHISLPRIETASYSKLLFLDNANAETLTDYFSSRVQTNFPGVDSPNAIVDSTPPHYSIINRLDSVWRRTIVADSPSQFGAQMLFYIAVPANQAGSKINNIRFTPYPMHSVDIVSLEYTTATSPKLDNSDGWRPLNDYALYNGDTQAIGHVPPGGWVDSSADIIENAGPLSFYFSPDNGSDTPITAIRIRMRQMNYINEYSKFVYTYGLSDLDIRFDRFTSSGKAIIRFDAPNGQVINSVNSVTPKIYNVPRSLVSSVFDYRVIYDVGSGVFSTINPGTNSSIWIEVTLTSLDSGAPPVLSDLIVDYS